MFQLLLNIRTTGIVTLVFVVQCQRSLSPGNGVSLSQLSARLLQESHKNLLQKFRWKVFVQPPYSPDLAKSDFHLKKFLSGHYFATDEDVQTTVTRWFHSQAADFYDTGLQKLL
ncbi:hypothetical protein AVEN_115010-1 [Araneus ventricosus]|uniref:Histone-lysine N-methyltransferase SETMAR n=1 Tax=Araneus ventricosus TaxID=182803 RepID=A0A4Y1ZXR2_ARAVE|nr:hypothetical protein AVEN_115010-1 [Araneus ventricosus]